MSLWQILRSEWKMLVRSLLWIVGFVVLVVSFGSVGAAELAAGEMEFRQMMIQAAVSFIVCIGAWAMTVFFE